MTTRDQAAGCDRRGRRQSSERLGACRSRVAAVATLAAAALASTLVSPPAPLLVWNATPSSRVGLYALSSADNLRSGDIVIAWAPDGARRLGSARDYLPADVPLVKRVGAVAGDRVCAIGAAIWVNGRAAALRRSRDPSGRPMPWWTGCRVLAAGELFLLSPAGPLAFDGRYFGLTTSGEVLGKGMLLWPR
jgi:conjugative transfer signal peptidase TraF